MQTAYQVLVASSEELLAKDQGDLVGQRQGGERPEHPGGIQGKPLESRMQCHWKVRVWTSSRPDSVFLESACFLDYGIAQTRRLAGEVGWL